jgi:uncharacterized SAM-binding protein YcdF (DUF218 family)
MPETARGAAATRRRRRLRIGILSVCAILIAALIAGLPVYVLPQEDHPRRADAILILGGPDYRRYGYGFNLGAEGWAPTVVVSNPNGADDPYLSKYCATPHREFTLVCFVPDPETTKGEGRELRRLAERYGWHTVIVVTIRPHISRARFILEQCFDGELVMVALPVQPSILEWAFHYVYQTAGYARAMLQPGC